MLTKNHDFKEIGNRRLDLNTTNRTHKNKSEIFLLVKSSDERTQNFFRKIRKILKNIKIETLKRLTIIFTDSTKLYLVIFEISKFTESKDELDKTTKSRVVSQVNKILANLFKYRKVLFLTKDFNFHSRKSRNSNNFRLFDEKLNDRFEKRRSRNKKNLIVDDLRNFSKNKTFKFLDDHFSQKRKNINNDLKYYSIMLIKIYNQKNQ